MRFSTTQRQINGALYSKSSKNYLSPQPLSVSQGTLKISLFLKTNHSQLIDQNRYIAFLVDWILETLCVLCTSVGFIANGSMYISLCLYIDGMVAGLKAQMSSLDQKRLADLTAIRSIYVKALKFHIDIVE